MPNFLKILLLLLLLGGTSWFGLRALQKNEAADAAGDEGGPPPPANVRVAKVRLVEARDTHRLIGTLRASSRSDLAAREEGAVGEILADESDQVEAGQVLIRIDPRRLEAQLAEARSAVTVAESLIAQRQAEAGRSETDLEMKRRLFEKQAVSQSELLDAEREAKVAESLGQAAEDQLAAALATVQLLEVRKEDLDLRAPFDARVVARHVEPGEWVRPGDPVFTLVATGPLEVWLQAPERYASTIATSAITIHVGERDFKTTNLKVVPEADSGSRVVTVIAEISDPEGTLVPGLSASADVAVSESLRSPAIPEDAVVTTYAGPAVFRVVPAEGDGPPIAERIPVETRFQENGTIFLKPGTLEAGDLIVVEGNERLFPQTPVAYEPPVENETAAGH